MFASLALAVVVLIIVHYAIQEWRLHKTYGHIPGPKGLPIIGNALQINKFKPWISMKQWAKEYGPVIKFRVFGRVTVVCTGPKAFRDCFEVKGENFAGREDSYRGHLITNNTGIMRYCVTDYRWRQSRKLLHSSIKVFGPGLSRIEHYAQLMSEEFIASFKAPEGQAIDPCEIIRDATTGMLILLVFGQKLDKKSEAFQAVKVMLDNVNSSFHVANDGLILDTWPCLRFFGNHTYKLLKEADTCINNYWRWYHKEVVPVEDIEKDDNMGKSYMKAFRDYNQTCPPDQRFPESELRANSAHVLFAGLLTTSTSFYHLILALMKHPDAKDKMVKEIDEVIGSRTVSINDKSKLPYVNAVINESIRCIPVGSFVLPHRSLDDSDILGIKIPKDTSVTGNFNSLFYNEEIYPEPEKFRPERFLDDNGHFLPPDHPIQKHFTPFGLGPRACVGKVFAQIRLFLWTVTLYQRFDIVPDPMHPLPSMLADDMTFIGVTNKTDPFKAKFIPKA